jgi:hypothetical protein
MGIAMALLRGAALLVFALLLAGCGLGGKEASNEITDEQLAVMVLPDDELGTPDGFELDLEDSGGMNAREAADWTTDPEDNAADLRQDGWLSGYELTYSNPDDRVSFELGEGVISGDSTVQLFDTETSARAQLVQEIKDLERLRGENAEGVRLARFETFDVDVGDEGWGIELTARARGVTLHGTGVLFRSGRLVADTGFLHVDETGRHSEAVAAARALESRIQRSLAGELDAEPIPLPGEQPEPTQAELSKMTLGLEDLPAGARLTDEGRTHGTDGVTYFRNFDVEQTMIGSSHLLFLRAKTQVFETKAGAQLLMRSLSTSKGRGVFAKSVLRGFSAVSGTRARNVRVGRLPGTRGNATGIVVTFDMAGRRFRTATIVVRSGRAVAVVSGFCTAHAVHPDDMPPLGERALTRLAAVPV